ncbi:BgTH12-01955 [Blumeria graminis f. sp. triticale]|uniref:BgTH12-01955 n=1 Tax=Blumeria graminis f. sp. triticale TaxID=1689686 RepID=A0A9W4D5I8_BLUGR|nr:BgTH12-01955 [Blumeria graminis f. sp. triticale]
MSSLDLKTPLIAMCPKKFKLSTKLVTSIRFQISAFSTGLSLRSGHNRWSKIKHDKGAADAKKNRLRSSLAHELALASRLYGPDPAMNPRLATLVANAKKVGFPKASLEVAIARGQGISVTGTTLESLTIEAIMPPTIALIIDCETDNKAKALMDIRFKIKSYGGTATSTNYLFQKKGRIVFENKEKALGVDDVLDHAIEAGAEDVEVDNNQNIVIWTNPSQTISTAKDLQKTLALKLMSSEIIWDANKDTLVPLTDIDIMKLNSLFDLVEDLQKVNDVQGVYANVTQGNLSDERWTELKGNLNA